MARRSSIWTRATYALICLALALAAAPCDVAAASNSGQRSTAKHSSGRPGRVQLGIDVLEQEKFAPLRGKHVGLITNHTGQDALGRSTIEIGRAHV